MKIFARVQFVFIWQLSLSTVAIGAGEIGPGTPVVFVGDIHEPNHISGIAKVGEHLVIGSDEGHVVQVLERVNDAKYKLKRKYAVPRYQLTKKTKKSKPEIDIEGITAVDETFYVIGSHSRVRSRVQPDNADGRSYSHNRERLIENKAEKSRRFLYRFKLDSEGQLVDNFDVKDDLYDFLKAAPLFTVFTKVPGKENGIDIEGIAAKGDRVFVGFRAPVLRENWVPILAFDFDVDLRAPDPAVELLFVNLGGLGIRDIAHVSDGYLLIAGPMGDGPGSYELYHWDGKDTVPGAGSPNGKVRHLGSIPTEPGAKAEGIVVLDETTTHFHTIVVWDGRPNGAPRKFLVKK